MKKALHILKITILMSFLSISFACGTEGHYHKDGINYANIKYMLNVPNYGNFTPALTFYNKLVQQTKESQNKIKEILVKKGYIEENDNAKYVYRVQFDIVPLWIDGKSNIDIIPSDAKIKIMITLRKYERRSGNQPGLYEVKKLWVIRTEIVYNSETFAIDCLNSILNLEQEILKI